MARALGLDLTRVRYFTDSMAVLFWLSTTMALSPYAGHRVAQILERSRFQQWQYVHTSQNPSDIPTRGMRAKDLADCRLWWEGPDFLQSPESEWPEQPYIRATEQSAAETRVLEDLSPQIVMTAEACRKGGRLSLLQKLHPILGTVRRAIRALRILGDLCFRRFGNESFRGSFLDWEAVWIKNEQQAVSPQACTGNWNTESGLPRCWN